MADIEIKQASLEDAEIILHLQMSAYLSEAEIYNDYSIPPGGKACALVAANGPVANSTITAAIATMLKATPVFEFINKRYG